MDGTDGAMETDGWRLMEQWKQMDGTDGTMKKWMGLMEQWKNGWGWWKTDGWD